MALTDKLTAIADAIRGKTGKSEELTLDQMVTEIEGIQAGGGESSGGGVDNDYLISLFDGTVKDLYIPGITEWNSFRCFEGYGIETVNLPDLVEFKKDYVFYRCASLHTVNLPNMQSWGASLFGQTALRSVRFPSFLGSLKTDVFNGCANLELVDLSSASCPASTSHHNDVLGQRLFSNCTALKTIILRRETKMFNLGNINAFDNTPFAAGNSGGTVYVPAALIPEYQTATNWSILYAAGTCNFVAIEGSEYE